HADGREEQHGRMSIRHKEARNEILILCGHARTALAAAPLRAIGRERNALDIAVMADGDDHILALDKILILELAFRFRKFRAARRRKFIFDRRQLVAHDAEHTLAGAENIEIVLDLLAKPLQLIPNFITAKRSEALQAQFKDRARLLFGHPDRAV